MIAIQIISDIVLCQNGIMLLGETRKQTRQLNLLSKISHWLECISNLQLFFPNLEFHVEEVLRVTEAKIRIAVSHYLEIIS